MIGDRFETYTFDYLMSLALSYVPDTVDKRQGSIIYDALAPACYELAAGYMEMRNIYKETYVQTATGEALDLRVAEQSIVRYAATYALKRADFFDAAGNPMEVPIGSRYSTMSDTNPINYVVEANYEDEEGEIVDGAYSLRCEKSGIIGNKYTGPMSNITFVQGLARVEMSTLLEPARDEEDDDTLRERYFESVQSQPFGGNIAQYKEAIGKIEGVGQVQVYPTWNGGGTVKCSVVDPQTNPISSDFIDTIQNLIDPENGDGDQGAGLGLAPIGHVVTISTPEEIPVDIECTVAVESGYSLSNLVQPIEDAFNEYLSEIRRAWGKADKYNRYQSTVYISRLTAAALKVPGVANVISTTMHGTTQDFVLEQTGRLQQLPVLGEVRIGG